jgi:hypothetical protein
MNGDQLDDLKQFIHGRFSQFSAEIDEKFKKLETRAV